MQRLVAVVLLSVLGVPAIARSDELSPPAAKQSVLQTGLALVRDVPLEAGESDAAQLQGTKLKSMKPGRKRTIILVSVIAAVAVICVLYAYTHLEGSVSITSRSPDVIDSAIAPGSSSAASR